MIIVALRNLICIIVLIVISPFLILAGVMILFEDGFPVFFSQNRLGLAETPFKIYKIRTMRKNTPQLGTHEIERSFQLKSGMIVRKFKIDEFPQLINVLKGDINLVGPRPGLENQNELKEARSLQNIFDIKPGITGLSQILGYNMSDPTKLAEIDKIYLLNQTNKTNFMILLGTFINFPRKYLSSKFNISENR